MYIWDCFSLGLRWEIHVVSLIMYTCVLQICMVSKKSFVIFDVVGCVVVVVVVVSCITCLQKGHTAWITAGMIWCTHLNGKKKSILHFREIELNDLQQLLIWRMGPQLKNSTGALQILFYSWFYKVIWIQCVKCLINKYMTNAVSCLPETALWNAHGHPFCKKKTWHSPYQQCNSTPICATRVFFSFIILLPLWWPIESKFSQVCYLMYICWDTPSENTGFWQSPKVSSTL